MVSYESNDRPAGAAVAIVLTGCSSSGGKSKSSKAGTPGSTGSSTGANEPSESPITIGSFASLNNPVYRTPQLKSELQAVISAVNAAGGVSGHPLKQKF